MNARIHFNETNLPVADGIYLSEIIGALSYALDLTEGQPPGHCLRCCWIGMHMAAQLNLSEEERSDLYYTLLLKDAGCSSNAARLFELYGNDERAIKHDFKTVNEDSFLQLGAFVLRHANAGRSLSGWVSRIINLARHGNELANELVETRCERGADIARQLGFSERVAMSVQALDEHWDGHGRPIGLSGSQIPLGSRIALIAQVTDVFFSIGGKKAALHELQSRSGKWFDPELIAIFNLCAQDQHFWQGLAADDIQSQVMRLEPQATLLTIDESRLDTIAEAFAQVVDTKSPFTYGHSERVADYANKIALTLGVSDQSRQWLRRGALLHDIGKLGVSNAILDKPGALDPDEWVFVKNHAQYSEEILSRIGIFSKLAVIAAAHHERLDGTGYPRGLNENDLCLETRIITVCDIFDALSADRPYRGAMPTEQALGIMQKMVGSALDPTCFEALKLILSQ
ncbi:MAG: HD domain-containing protein [Proteobacteria bacterium]|nr:HD domain-containing protein [Pseudomonadota bacterium]